MTDRRRRALLVASGSLLLVRSPAARATPVEVQAAIDALAQGRPVQPGRVELDLPALVESGNSVALTVQVDSPMTADDHVRSIHVFVQRNPQPHVAVFHLGPRCGRARVSTRIRLADSQTVVAVCLMSDGTLWSGSADSVVTQAACAEEP